MIQELLRVNWQLFEDVNQRAGHQPLLDALMIFGANDVIVLMPLLLLALWFGLARWSPLGRRLVTAEVDAKGVTARRLGQRLALLGCLAVGFALAINITLGNLFYEPRPFISHPATVHKLIPYAADASFPSDHEAVAGSIATTLLIYALLLLVRRVHRAQVGPLIRMVSVLVVLGVLAIFWIGVARVYVGVHYPADIVGGVCCGALGALIAAALMQLLRPILDGIIRLAELVRLA